MARKPSPRRTLTGMTKAKAARFINRLSEVCNLGYTKLYITCGWDNRRFVIESCNVITPEFANENIIAIDTNIEIERFVNEIIKFGAKREYEYRNKKEIENVFSADNGLIHLVPAYNHISLCRHKSSAWGPALKYTPDPEIWCRECWQLYRYRARDE
ncbi:hypothetical protein [Comamonas sp. wu1-DMT]|uniref:hypothetical protein n=1 Tax=Comamonas sp. wu1-DMT TaxID=3126390 RepID=UPI0032E47760